MCMKQKYDDTFLARWLENKLTKAELEEFKASKEYNEYHTIINTLNSVEMPSFEVEKNFKATLNKRDKLNQTTFRKRVIALWSFTAAASIVLVIFVYGFFFSPTIIETNYAEKTNFELPDGSQVNMNSGSHISYKKFNWKDSRSLQLSGEAFFKVKKGEKFKVNSANGSVIVLGTQFSVNSRGGLFQIECFEGKVLVVTKKNDSIVLTKGLAFREQYKKQKEYTIEKTTSSWLKNQSTFYDMPILEVIEELERQFDILILGKENLVEEKFTGRFSHNDKNIALKTVFLAMDIKYQVDKNGNILIIK